MTFCEFIFFDGRIIYLYSKQIGGEMDLPKEKYARNLVICAYILIITAILYLFFKYLLSPLIPFIIAWIGAMLLRPAIDKASRRTKLPRKLVAFFCVAFVFTLIFSLVGMFFSKVISELKEISVSLVDDTASIIGEVFSFAEGLPFLKNMEDTETALKLRGAVTDMVSGALTNVCSRIPTAVMSMASCLPNILLFSITLVLAAFYLGADVGDINNRIIRFFPEEKRKWIFEAKKKLLTAGMKYIKAYVVILLITFTELLVGFFILKIPYALTLAAVIAIIDILPVLGVGTVLIPWGIVLLIIGDSKLAAGIFVLYGIIWVVRQITEPRIVGKSMGLPPLFTLAAMYIGYSLLGFSGLFVFPIAAMILKCLYDIGILKI